MTDDKTIIRAAAAEPVTVDLGIPNHECKRLLGEGGMASVWLCWDKNLKRDIAVKVIGEEISNNPEFLARFKTEAEALAKFDHRNIVAVYNYGKSDTGRPYILMQYLTGGNLGKLIESGELDEEKSANIAEKLADALHYAHERGIVHRDVKPLNILMRDEEPVLSDFGVAKSLGNTNLTQVRMVVGAPLYMAPEQERGDSVTEAADVFSFGLVFYQMLTGKLPHSSNRAIYSDEQKNAITHSLGSVNTAYVDIICRCLAANPEARPTAEECRSTIAEQLGAKPASRMWIGLTVLAAAIVASVALFLNDEPPLLISVTPLDAEVFVEGQMSTNKMLTDKNSDQEVIVISPGYIGEILSVSAASLSPITLSALRLPSTNEVKRFEMQFFMDAPEDGAAFEHYPFKALLELKKLSKSNTELFEQRMAPIAKLARLGDQASALIYFLSVEEDLLAADKNEAVEILIAAMNSGYALASYYRAIHIFSQHIEKNGLIPIDVRSKTYRDYSGALTLADQQGLTDLAAIQREKEKMLNSSSN